MGKSPWGTDFESRCKQFYVLFIIKVVSSLYLFFYFSIKTEKLITSVVFNFHEKMSLRETLWSMSLRDISPWLLNTFKVKSYHTPFLFILKQITYITEPYLPSEQNTPLTKPYLHKCSKNHLFSILRHVFSNSYCTRKIITKLIKRKHKTHFFDFIITFSVCKTFQPFMLL
jgi:hypothetical protein